jgi:hypothetical protein
MLTAPQWTRLRRSYDDEHDRRATRPNYPAPRLRGTVTLPSGQVITAPKIPTGSPGAQMHVYPFNIQIIAARRSTISTPLLNGNLYILDFTIFSTSHTDPPTETYEIGYALQPVFENKVVLTTPRPYTVLTELLDPFATILDDRGTGFPGTTLITPDTRQVTPLGILVTQPRAAITLTVVSAGVLAQAYYGHFRVLEGLDPTQPYPFA